jgi:pimeloyl-ACP methyl ester carboxylesterase
MPVTSEIYYFVHGGDLLSTPPILLIHGAGGTHLNWPAQIRRLAGRRVFALDLPGHGKSGGVGCQSIDEYVSVVLNFMNAVRLSGTVLVGHSMGSAIALAIALKHPARVLGLGLVGSGARLRVAKALLELASNPASFLSVVKMVTENSYSASTDQRLKELGAQRMADARPSVLSGDFLACDSFDVMEQVHKIKVPTLIICGQDDLMTPPNRSEYLHDQIQGSELQIIEQAGHMVMLERPNEVSASLDRFIDHIPA